MTKEFPWSTVIQTIAAVIQAIAAAVFLGSVVWESKRRARLAEQQRRDRIIAALHFEWSQVATPGPPKTPAEIGGLFSERQIDFFNARLHEMGEPWSYPFPRM
jgi:hypothetical protein